MNEIDPWERLKHAVRTALDYPNTHDIWRDVRDALDAVEKQTAPPGVPAVPIDAEDLWTDYRTERMGLGDVHRLAFLAGVEAGRRTAPASPALTEEEARAWKAIDDLLAHYADGPGRVFDRFGEVVGEDAYLTEARQAVSVLRASRRDIPVEVQARKKNVEEVHHG